MSLSNAEKFGTTEQRAPRERSKAFIGSTAILSAIAFLASVSPSNAAESAKERETVSATSVEKKSKKSTEKANNEVVDRSSLVGNVDLTRMLPTDRIITATRRNGEVISVPGVRSPDVDGPEAFMESVLADIACYLTTSDEACLDDFNDGPKQDLLKIRKDLMDSFNHPDVSDLPKALRKVAKKDASKNHKKLQAVIFDSPENPSHFSYGEDDIGHYYELDEGDLFFRQWIGVPGANEWQDEKALIINEPGDSTNAPDHVIPTLRVYYSNNKGQQGAKITDFYYDIEPNPVLS